MTLFSNGTLGLQKKLIKHDKTLLLFEFINVCARQGQRVLNVPNFPEGGSPLQASW